MLAQQNPAHVTHAHACSCGVCRSMAGPSCQPRPCWRQLLQHMPLVPQPPPLQQPPPALPVCSCSGNLRLPHLLLPPLCCMHCKGFPSSRHLSWAGHRSRCAVYVWMYGCVYVRLCVNVCLCMCVCVCVCMCVFVCLCGNGNQGCLASVARAVFGKGSCLACQVPSFLTGATEHVLGRGWHSKA